MMTGNEIREKFLQYFGDHDHEIVESSSLVPADDPTLLFTNAGMVQFKRLFMGEEKRDYVRAATSQRCVRAGGKHNDLDNVGYTARHHTFFEMLGNFSFGDYFKHEAIHYAWDFLTNVIKLPKEKLWISVFREDDEAYELWQQIAEVPEDRIVRLDEEENFWAMGDTGPCGPCSEIHYDQGEVVGCGKPDCRVGCDCDRWLEIWNLVFMQFNREEDGTMKPLPKPSIDTGMGLERIASVVQGKHTNYDSDLFTSIFEKISTVTGRRYGDDPKSDTAMRVIADHCRATTFLVADGVLPANEGRGYVLRRIIRRAIRFGRTLGMKKPFMSAVTQGVIDQMQDAYPHLMGAADLLEKVVVNEEERFLETIDHGLAMLKEEMARLKKKGQKQIDGDFIFRLYDTFGFPVDIVRDIAIEKGMIADEAGFNTAMESQRQQSKKSWKGAGLEKTGPGITALRANGVRSTFVGYDTRRQTSRIIGLLDEKGAMTDKAESGARLSIVCAETPFYAEAGGQVGDNGRIVAPNGSVTVENTMTTGDNLILHTGRVDQGAVALGEEVELRVAEGRRQYIANNHSATHLLHAALREILGEHVKQSGSLVMPERLRFDFTHFNPVSSEELQRIENRVNEEIRANTGISTDILDREQAIRSGATALFGEKYDDAVRVVSVGDYSKELCGGTHVGSTGEIGVFKILSESGIAAGIRRIEAVTGAQAIKRFQELEQTVRVIADRVKSSPEEVTEKLEKIINRQKELEKEIGELTTRLSVMDLDKIIESARNIDDVPVIVAKIPIDSPRTMREVGDKVRDKMNSGIAVLGGELNGKASLLAIVSKDLTKTYHAGNIVKEVAALVGGGGGGRPDMAQAGGSMPDKLDEALNRVYEIIERQRVKE